MATHIGPTLCIPQKDDPSKTDLSSPGPVVAQQMDNPMCWGAGVIEVGWYFITPENGNPQFALDPTNFEQLYTPVEGS